MWTGFLICHLSIFCGKLLWIHWIPRWKIWVEVTGCLKNVRDLPKLSCFSFLLPLVQSLLLPPAQDLSHCVCSLPPRWIWFSKTKLSLDPPTALSTDAQCQTSYQDTSTPYFIPWHAFYLLSCSWHTEPAFLHHFMLSWNSRPLHMLLSLSVPSSSLCSFLA